MENIIELTNRYMLESNITKLPVDYHTLCSLLEAKGFSVMSYNQGRKIIKTLSLERYAKKHPAFTVIADDIKITMYRDEISLGEKLFCLAHELGHIILFHTPLGVMGKQYENDEHISLQEQEADNFAYTLLAPIPILSCFCKTISDISRATLLNDYRSAVVMSRIQNYNYSSSDFLLSEKFKEYISCARVNRSIQLPLPSLNYSYSGWQTPWGSFERSF